MRDQHKGPHEFAAELPSCPVRWQTLASEDRTPAFLQLATKAAAVATAALTTAPEAPKAIRPILGSARNVTRTGYLATKALGGNEGIPCWPGSYWPSSASSCSSAGTVVIGLTGTVIALVGLYLIALGAWGIHRGLLGALIGFTALLAVGALTLHWVRTEVWGTAESSTNGLVPRDVLPWLRSTWWGGLVLLGGLSCWPCCPASAPAPGARESGDRVQAAGWRRYYAGHTLPRRREQPGHAFPRCRECARTSSRKPRLRGSAATPPLAAAAAAAAPAAAEAAAILPGERPDRVVSCR